MMSSTWTCFHLQAIAEDPRKVLTRADMQSVFERFLEQLSEGVDEVDFRSALDDVTSQLDLLAFA
ncbi:hypothetical protein [Mesorhizobium sp. M1348]|uniref:hypothetical protein n=1 Tax=Mesorhizobium sp. M1348 TaxID=2957089 RepID=UPI0033368277